MDTGSKTLAQLSEENKEAKYVTLEVGSKISGYTKDYLERLCHLNKVAYKLWNNGAFVIELESLLHETQAILLSYEGVTFVDRAELTEPVGQISTEGSMLSSASREVDTRVATMLDQKDMEGVEHQALVERATREIPRFSDTEEGSGNPFSFVGRAVVSDVEPKSMKGGKISPKIATAAVPEVKPAVGKPMPVVEMKKEEKIEENIAQKISAPSPAVVATIITPSSTGMHLTIKSDTEEETSLTHASPLTSAVHLSVTGDVRVVVPHAPTKLQIVTDVWDEELLGKEVVEEEGPHEAHPTKLVITEVIDKEDTSDVVSPYRPVQTSIDREPHDDPAPLFPVIKKKTEEVKPVAEVKNEMKADVPASSVLTHAFVETLPVEQVPPSPMQKVVVFEPALEEAVKAVPKSVTMSARIAAVDSVLGTDPTPMIRVPTPVAPKTDRVPLPPSLAAIPMHEEEHHLSIYEQHPLMKSTGFNAVFAVMLIGASFLMLGGTYLQSVGSSVNSATYVAGVGASQGGATLTGGVTPSPSEEVGTPVSGGVLPFSNDIVATSGEKENTVIVRPVFGTSTGKAYEFMIVPVPKQ